MLNSFKLGLLNILRHNLFRSFSFVLFLLQRNKYGIWQRLPSLFSFFYRSFPAFFPLQRILKPLRRRVSLKVTLQSLFGCVSVLKVCKLNTNKKLYRASSRQDNQLIIARLKNLRINQCAP